jgi:putative ABC transport system permease protein
MSWISHHPILRLVASPTHLWRTTSLGLKSIWLHKLRSFLTALGVVFGVASVVAMLAIGEGASEEAQEQIRKLGSQNIILESVKPPDSEGSSNETRSMVIEYGLTLKDIEQIRQTIPGISVVVPSRMISENIWHLEHRVDGQVMGVLPIYPQMRNRELIEGRFFSELEQRERLSVCVLSESAAKALFPLETPTGKSVRVRQHYYKVIGVVEDEGQRIGGDSGGTSAAAAQVMIPFNTLMDHYGETFFRFKTGGFEAERVEFHETILRVEDVEQVESRAEAVRHLLTKNHSKEDWRMIVPVELLEQAAQTKRIFSIVLGSIAAISLLVGGIGIMNIMLASVTERTREIGIRRALGARQADIVVQFLVETVLLSGAGGIIGVVLGIAIPIIVQEVAGVTTVVKAWAPTLAFSISVITGIAFGIYPARRAAAMNPVQALRHE